MHSRLANDGASFPWLSSQVETWSSLGCGAEQEGGEASSWPGGLAQSVRTCLAAAMKVTFHKVSRQSFGAYLACSAWERCLGAKLERRRLPSARQFNAFHFSNKPDSKGTWGDH